MVYSTHCMCVCDGAFLGGEIPMKEVSMQEWGVRLALSLEVELRPRAASRGGYGVTTGKAT